MANFSHMDELLKQFSENTVPGCACAVAQNGKILYEGYYGYADLEKKKPVTEDSVFRLFSMTKVIVCTAALMLFERGKYKLNDPFSDYFPEYKNTQVAEITPNGSTVIRPAKSPMLVRHTFNMCTGLPYPSTNHPTDVKMREVLDELEQTKGKGKFTVQDDVRALGAVPVRFDPGEQWLYGVGHDMVAAFTEVVSGMTVGEFLKKEIFEPLGMESTGFRYFGDIKDRLVQMYEPQADGSFKQIRGIHDDYMESEAVYESGGGGLFGTVRDYLTFTQMLANGGVHNGKRIIGRNTIDLMRRNMLNDAQMKDFSDTYNEGYGYGLGVRTLLNPAGVTNMPVGEFGWTGAAGTWTSIDPADGFSVVYMHQMMPNQEEYHHHRVRSVAYGCME